MDNLELHGLFQAEEEALQQAFKRHRLIRQDHSQVRRQTFPSLLRDVFEFPDDALCLKLKVHIELGAEVDATPANNGVTAFRRCFGDGKMASMRLLLAAGAQSGWTPDQVSLALGAVPDVPQTGEADPFCFACRVGNLDAAQEYVAKFESGLNKSSDAVIVAVKARATDVVKWLMGLGFDPNAVDGIEREALERAVDNDDIAYCNGGSTPCGGSRPFRVTGKNLYITRRKSRFK